MIIGTNERVSRELELGLNELTRDSMTRLLGKRETSVIV